jgi:hypothetical protein
MKKPGTSQFALIIGLILQGVGGVIYSGAFFSSLSRSIYSDTSGSSVGMGIGGIVAVIGWIVLLVGISKASSAIDYLVSISTPPVSDVERRAQESRLAADQE